MVSEAIGHEFQANQGREDSAGGCGAGLGLENERVSDPLCSEAQKFRE